MPLNRQFHNDTGWRVFVRTVLARAYPRVIVNVRERWWMFFDIILPLIGLQLLGMLVAMTAVLGVTAVVVFGWCDHAARERGLIDRTTNY